MKTLFLPKDPAWWVWTITALLLAAGLAGFDRGYQIAILLSAVQTIFFLVRLRSPRTSAVQIRSFYTLLLIACYPPAMHWLFWLPTVGTFALVIFGYCPLARVLSLMPWNRTGKLTARLVWRTFASSPVATRRNPPSSAPPVGCPGGVCVIESYAAEI